MGGNKAIIRLILEQRTAQNLEPLPDSEDETPLHIIINCED